MSAIAQIKFSNPQPIPSRDRGDRPEIAWLPVAALSIDKAYQREILENGRKNIRHIIEHFRWSHFAPLVVARRAGGQFAIIDGQHRAVSARALGLVEVPCLVVSCSVEEEADAFASINGNVTKPNALQIFFAKLAAGDAKARELRDVCAAAGVVIPRNVIPVTKPGETLAIGSLQSCLSKHGKDVLILALKCIMETAKDRNIGLLRAGIIAGLCEAIAARPGWMREPLACLRAIESVTIRKLWQNTERIRVVDGGSCRAVFAEQLYKHVSPLIKKAA